MWNFNKINNFSGWIAFIISLIVYSITVEDTASFWDSGEFIAVSSKLEVPHPPGAPFYLLLGRIFSLLALGNTENIALAINFLSVVASSFTILFLCSRALIQPNFVLIEICFLQIFQTVFVSL